MYAIIELVGQQVKVEKDGVFSVNRVNESDKGKTFKVESVLFGRKGNKHYVGAPYVKGAYVECEPLGPKRGKKVIAYKYAPRKSSQTKKGHRQELSVFRVKDIHLE